MAQTTFNIPDESLAAIMDALLNLYPIPTQMQEVDGEMVELPKYDMDIHPEVCVKNWLIQQVNRWQEVKAQRAAKEAISPINIELT